MLIREDFGFRVTDKEDDSKSTRHCKVENEIVGNEPLPYLLWDNETLHSPYPSDLRPDPPKKILHDFWRRILFLSIPIVIYFVATTSSLGLALWWTIVHDDISGGFTMGAYVWGVVVFPTGYWHWIRKNKVADEEDVRELEELEANRTSETSRIERAGEDPVEVQ